MKINKIHIILVATLAKNVFSSCPSAITNQGYQCCNTCNIEYTDNDGQWGVENQQWCGIQDYCSNLPTDCPSVLKNLGYNCCSGCEVVFNDENGDWGIENDDWCSMSSKCSTNSSTKKTKTTSVTTPTASASQDDVVDVNRKVQNVVTSNYSSGTSVHDPSVVKNGSKYYIFGSHMDTATSTDLWTWNRIYTGVNENNRMFTNLFSKSNYAPFSYVGKNSDNGYSVWAPDVHFNKDMGKWVQYFCTTSTFIKSNLCYATADNIEGPYTYQGTFLYSGMVSSTVGKTNLKQITGSEDGNRYYPNNTFNHRKFPNAIDPSVFYDFNDRLWLTYGSWSGGIYILELNKKTGLPIHPSSNTDTVDRYYGKKLAGGNHQSIEGPYILPHKASGYYFLFVSYGSLVATGGYQIRLFRSKNPDGPYTDLNGSSFMSGTNSNFGIKVMGNYNLPGLSKAYMAPGHNSALVDSNGKTLLVYHTRFNAGSEYHEPRVHQMFLNKEGWLVAAPYAYTGETISKTGYGLNDIVGSYKYMVHLHAKINGDIPNCYTINLNQDFTVTGRATGTWSYEKGTPYMTITVNNIKYSGVFVKQLDEAKAATVTSFTAVGNNDSIWGVRY